MGELLPPRHGGYDSVAAEELKLYACTGADQIQPVPMDVILSEVKENRTSDGMAKKYALAT